MFLLCITVAVRHKPSDYDGGGGSLAMEAPTRPYITRHAVTSDAVDRPQTPPFSVDVDACLRLLTSPRRSSSSSTREVTRDVIVADSNPPLSVPDWLTSTDDLTSLIGSTRYINPFTVESILRRRGIERLEPAACVDDTTHTSREARHRITDIGRYTTSGCVDRNVIDVVEYCSPRSSSMRTTEGSATVDVVDRRRSIDDERQASVSCVSEIKTRVREIAIASGSECYYSLRCLSYDTAKTVGCWPRRLPNEQPVTKPTQSLIPSSCAVNIPPVEAATDLPNGGTSKVKRKKRVSFADRMTTIVVYSNETPTTCDAESTYVSATFTGNLSTSLSGAPQRCESIDDESELVAVVSSMSEDDVDSVDVDAEDDEGFVDEHGITSSVSGPGATLSIVPQHADLVRCGLCQRRWVFPPVHYCVDCETYFARLASA